MSRNNLDLSSIRSSDNLIILQLEEKLVVTGNNEMKTQGIVRWHGSKEKNGHVFCPMKERTVGRAVGLCEGCLLGIFEG